MTFRLFGFVPDTSLGHINVLIPSQSILFSLMLRAKRKVTYCNFTVFDLTRPGLEPTIYRTRGEHANHYTIDAVRNENYLGKCSLLYNVLNSILIVCGVLSTLNLL